MIELIVVIVIIGILAVAVVPRWNSGTFEDRGYRDEVISGLRYAHKSAVASRRTTCATFGNSPTQVSFRVSTTQGAADCSVGSALVLPASATNVLLPRGSGVTFSGFPASVIFDSAGRPNAGAAIGVANLPATLNIIVEPETGYVH